MEENTKPSREKIVQWYKDEIELAQYRAQLAQLQRDATVHEAERLQAISIIAQITQDPSLKEEAAPEPTKMKAERKLKKDPEDGC